MEYLLWIVVAVLLLMCLTALKALWKIQAAVKSLELDIEILKGSVKDARDSSEENTKILKGQLMRLVAGEKLTPEMVLEGKLYKDLAPYEGLQLYQNEKHLFVLDVRTQGEYELGHIPNAKWIAVDQLDTRIRELPKEKAMRMLVYCQGGGRSAVACEHLSRIGYTQVHNLAGGMSNWTGPVEQGMSVRVS